MSSDVDKATEFDIGLHFFNFSDISLWLETLHNRGRCINMQRGRLHILFLFFKRYLFLFYLFIYLFILAPGGGPVPFVHPRKYAPDCDLKLYFGIFSVLELEMIRVYYKHALILVILYKVRSWYYQHFYRVSLDI